MAKEVGIWIGSRIFCEGIFGGKDLFFYDFLAKIFDRFGVQNWIGWWLIISSNFLKARCLSLLPVKAVLEPLCSPNRISLIE